MLIANEGACEKIFRIPVPELWTSFLVCPPPVAAWLLSVSSTLCFYYMLTFGSGGRVIKEYWHCLMIIDNKRYSDQRKRNGKECHVITEILHTDFILVIRDAAEGSHRAYFIRQEWRAQFKVRTNRFATLPTSNFFFFFFAWSGCSLCVFPEGVIS